MGFGVRVWGEKEKKIGMKIRRRPETRTRVWTEWRRRGGGEEAERKEN